MREAALNRRRQSHAVFAVDDDFYAVEGDSLDDLAGFVAEDDYQVIKLGLSKLFDHAVQEDRMVGRHQRLDCAQTLPLASGQDQSGNHNNFPR
jgi:hypothetical protein